MLNSFNKFSAKITVNPAGVAQRFEHALIALSGLNQVSHVKFTFVGVLTHGGNVVRRIINVKMTLNMIFNRHAVFCQLRPVSARS